MARARFAAGLAGSVAAALVGAGCDRGDAPAPTPSAGPPWFVDAAAERRLTFRHVSGESEYLFPEIMGGGAALFDMDGDGDLDAYLVQSGSFSLPLDERPPNRLYRNVGGGRFEDVTDGSHAGDRGYGMGVATGDFDGDGDLDLYVTNVGANTLLRNEGDGRFTDVTRRARVGDPGWGCSAAFLDIDRDGDLDLFVTNYIAWSPATDTRCRMVSGQLDYCSPNSYDAPAPDVLYRNDGDGRFTDISLASGLRAAFGNGLGVVCGDFDGDAWTDIFVANDQRPDQLWQNRGDGTFTDTAMLRGCAVDQHGEPRAGMGTVAVDHDDDGDLDLLVVNLRAEPDLFYRNDGAVFTDATALVRLGAVSRPYTRFGVGTPDLDNDGYLDLFVVTGRVVRLTEPGPPADDPYAEPNLLFRGGAEGRFTEVLPRGGTTPELVATSRGAAFGDVDDDGGIDVLVVNRDGPAHLLMNVVPDRGHWVSLRVLDKRGADAIGAVVSLVIDGRTITREVRTTYSYLSANDPRIHLGLGDSATPGAVRVRWVDGTEETYLPPAPDRTTTIRQTAGDRVTGGTRPRVGA